MNATGKRRLLKLADFLETEVPPDRFDMRNFADAIADGRPACGTTACAGGWAANIPSFRKAGYCLKRLGPWFTPVFGEEEGFGALQSFFGLDHDDTLHIFDSHDPETGDQRCDTPAMAAQRIRKLVASA